MITANDIQQFIQTHLPEAQVSVEGEDGHHFTAVVIADSFAGLSPVKRQQMVYATLGDRLQTGEIHALALKTLTPDEWKITQQ